MPGLLLSALIYVALLALLAGTVSPGWPLRFLRIRSRTRGAIVAAVGFATAAIAVAWPASLEHAADSGTHLDRFLPAYHFAEVHEIRVHAPASRVFEAIQDVRADEIALYRTLTWIRSPRFGSSRPGILNPPAERPILESAFASGFRVLADEPPTELVFGVANLLRLREAGGSPTMPLDPVPGGPDAFARPGPEPGVRVAMNFRVTDEGNGWCGVRTETRGFASGASARRRFAVYWRVIYPGSDLIRRMWLRAIRTRAEGLATPDGPASALG